jgi:hypothetical protein
LTAGVRVALVGGACITIVTRYGSIITSGFGIAAVAITIVNKAGDGNRSTSIDRIARVNSTKVTSFTAYVDMNTSRGRIARVVCAHIVVVTLVRYVGVDTTRIRIARVISTFVVIITSNQSVHTLTRTFVTSIGRAKIIIITIHGSEDTSFYSIASIGGTLIVVIASDLGEYATSILITTVVRACIIIITSNGNIYASNFRVTTVISTSVVVVTSDGREIASAGG